MQYISFTTYFLISSKYITTNPIPRYLIGEQNILVSQNHTVGNFISEPNSNNGDLNTFPTHNLVRKRQ